MVMNSLANKPRLSDTNVFRTRRKSDQVGFCAGLLTRKVADRVHGVQVRWEKDCESPDCDPQTGEVDSAFHTDNITCILCPLRPKFKYCLVRAVFLNSGPQPPLACIHT